MSKLPENWPTAEDIQRFIDVVWNAMQHREFERLLSEQEVVLGNGALRVPASQTPQP